MKTITAAKERITSFSLMNHTGKKLLLVIGFITCLLSFAKAQTNPTAQSLPYSQNFGTTTFSSMPTGTAAWTVSSSPIGTQSSAESSTDNGNASVTATSSVQTTGDVYGYETSSNGMLYIQTSSNSTNGTNQLAVAVNTTNNINILVSYDIEMISAEPRTIGVELQYRVGTSGSWTTVSGTAYSHNSSDRSNGNVDHFTSISLPSGANNNSAVQLRWITWRGSETGNSSGISIDNISVTGTNTTDLIYRSVKNGNWSQIGTWQVSTDSSTWTASSTIPNYNSKTITIQSGDTVTIDSSTTIDQVIVNGVLVYGNYSGSTITFNNGPGTDLIINGTYEDIGPNTNTWSSGATWSMGSNGTLLRTRSTSSDDWRDSYQGGISNIPSTAYWILWKTGTETPYMSSTSAMYYPNLILENTSGSSYAADGAEGFEGSSDYPRIKGYLDVGGTGTGAVVLSDSNTNSTPVPVDGKITVRSGSELRIAGTGIAAHKDVEIDGILQYGASNGRTLTFAGGVNETFSGSGTINIYNLTVNDSLSTDTVFLTRAMTVTNTLTITKGILDCERHQLTNSANPSVSLSPSSSTVCSGSPVTLTASNYSAYIWTPSTGLNATTGASVTASPTSTTTYTIYGSTASKYTCALGTDIITTNPLPTLTVTPSSASYCIGGSTSLTASGASTYTWAPNTNLSATTGATVTANPTSTTTYTVTGTNSNGCVNTKTVVVTVNPLPTLTITPSSASICTGSSTSLTASGANTYTWAPNTNLSATTGATVTANPVSTITYTITGTNSNGCVNTQTVVITVNPLPTLTITPSSSTICTGSSTSLTANGASTYTWSPSTGLNVTTGATVSANPTSTTTYTVTGTNSNGCINTQTAIIIVNPLPTLTITPSSSTICTGSATSLTASGASTYTWGPSTGLGVTTGATVSANPTSTITYTITGTNSNGCVNTQTAIVTVNPNPTITITASLSGICSGSSDSLTVSGAATYLWSNSATTNLIVVSPTLTTTYTVTGTNTYGCTDTISQSVLVSNCQGNSCASAISITPTTTYAPVDYSFLPGQSGEWFSFTADSATMVLNFTYPVSAVDTPVAGINIITVYTGSCGGLTLIASDTIPSIKGLFPSIMDTDLTPGQTYFVEVNNVISYECSSCNRKARYFGVSLRSTHRPGGGSTLGTANVPIIQWQYADGPDWTAPSGITQAPKTGYNSTADWFYDIIASTDPANPGYFACGYSEVVDNSYPSGCLSRDCNGVLSTTQSVFQPIIASFSATGTLNWEQIYTLGTPHDQGYFYRIIQTTDPSHELVALGCKQPQYTSCSPSYSDNVIAVQIDPNPLNNGAVLAGPYYYAYVGGSMVESSASVGPVTGGNDQVGQYQGARAVYNSSGGLDGFIMSVWEFSTNPASTGLLKLDATLTPESSFGNGGYQTYQYTYVISPPHVLPIDIQVANNPSDVEVINNGTSNPFYAVTGWITLPDNTQQIYLLTADASGNRISQTAFSHNYLKSNGYSSRNRYWSNLNMPSYTNPPIDWGMNLLWQPGTSTLQLNAACNWTSSYNGQAGLIYYPNQNTNDSYITFTDAIMSFAISGTSLSQTNIVDVAPFDGRDFTPRMVQTPDGGVAVAGNITYTSPDFPSPQLEAQSNNIAAGGTCGSLWSTTLPTLLGVNADLVKMDANLNVQWNQQYRGWLNNNPTPPNIALTCFWGLIATSDGFVIAGTNEVNGNDFEAFKLQYPQFIGTGVTTAVSQINQGNIINNEPLLDIQIPTGTTTTWNTNMNIEGVVDVEPGATLVINNNAVIQFADKLETGLDSKIVVEQGGTVISPQGGSIVQPTVATGGILTITGSGTTVTAIPGTSNGGTMWQGIEVGSVSVGNSGKITAVSTAQGRVNINSGATLSNAIIGINDERNDPSADPPTSAPVNFPPYNNPIGYNMGEAHITCNNANFINNYNAVQLVENAYNLSFNNFTNCNFTTNAAIGHGLIPTYFITVTSNSATITGNTLSVDPTYWSSVSSSNYLSSGISGINASFNATNNTFTNLNVGVYQTTSNPSINVIVSNNTFNDNLTSINLDGSSYSTINSNNINITKNLHKPGPFIPLAWTASGILLNLCHNYSLQDNILTVTAPSQPSYGIIVDNSNSTTYNKNIQINNNSLTNFSAVTTFYMFGNKYHTGGTAIQAQDNNEDLQIHCNVNSANNLDIAAITTNTVTMAPVAASQGVCLPSTDINYLTSPAGNIFSYPSTSSCTGIEADIYSNLYGFTYTHHTNAATTPPTSCYNTPVNPTVCSGATYSNWATDACPDQLVSPACCYSSISPACCIATHRALKQTHDSAQAVIDSGNASKLYHVLRTGTPAQIQDSLLAPGPYLSDSLLLATINDTLPFDTLRNILIPNAPLTSRVIEAALSLSGLPGSIHEQLEAAQETGPSARRQLNEVIYYYAYREDISANAIVRSYLSDTTGNGPDSAIVFLQTIPGVESMSEQADINISIGQYSSASTLVSSIESTNLMNDFCSLSKVLIQLGDSGKTVYQMDSIQIDTVKSIAYRTAQTQTTLNAQAILRQVYGLSFHDTIMPILDSGSGHRAIRPQNNNTNTTQNPLDSIVQGNVKLYPNPANNKLTIAYNLDNNSTSDLVIYDLMGNMITKYNLPSNQGVVNENISNLSTGFYVYCVETGNKVVQRGKFIVTR